MEQIYLNIDVNQFKIQRVPNLWVIKIVVLGITAYANSYKI